MQRELVILTASFFLAVGADAALAQMGGGPMMRDGQTPMQQWRGQQRQEMPMQRDDEDDQGAEADDDRADDARGQRAERGDRHWRDGPRSGRRGMMMGRMRMSSGMLRMAMILIDTNGDGAVSLDEAQAAQERVFRAADANGDGRLTYEEMRDFMRELRGGRRAQQRGERM